jgi:phosphatidylinositol alpha-1,6-mannosyltransferase
VLVHRLIRHWHGLQAMVLTATPGQIARSEGEPHFTVRRAWTNRSSRPQQMALLNLSAIAEARRFRPDVVLSAHIVLAPAAWMISRFMRVPYVEYVHGAEVANRPRLAKFAVRGAAAVIAVSRFTGALVRQWIAESKIHQIPPGVDMPVSPNGAARSPSPLVVTVARLSDRRKGHDVMIRALPLIRERVPDLEWVVVGDGRLRVEYERQTVDNGLSEYVRFVGEVNDTERDQWLDRASVFAMPSRLAANGGGEGFGIAYLEAAAHGVPVVAGNVGGAPDAVIDHVTGLLVDPTDHAAVATAIAELLIDRRLAESLGCAGQVRARSMAWPNIAQRVEDLLHRVAVRAA